MIQNKKLKFFSFILISSCLFFSFSSLVFADNVPSTPEISNCPSGVTCVDDPLSSGNTAVQPVDIIARIAKAIIAPIGAIAFLFFVIGGFYWIFSGGNDERIKKGRDIMKWSIIGIVVIFSSYAVLNFILKILGVL